MFGYIVRRLVTASLVVILSSMFVFALFFIFGGITSLNDVILPKLKELFTLNYTQAMLVQFCFFTAYLVIGIPGAQVGDAVARLQPDRQIRMLHLERT